jgi:hypothetical protein
MPQQGKTFRENEAARRTQARIPNKTQWSLSDILRFAGCGWEHIADIYSWIERQQEPCAIDAWIAKQLVEARHKFDVKREAQLMTLASYVKEQELQLIELAKLVGSLQRELNRIQISALAAKAGDYVKHDDDEKGRMESEDE